MERERTQEQGREDREVRAPESVEGRQHRSPARRDLGRGPFSAFDRMRDEMNRVFESAFGTSLLPARGFGARAWSPTVEMFEREGKLVVRADLPGMSKDDVEINIENDMLTIEGERRSERRDEERGYSERSYGRFVRSIPLSPGVNAESAKASFRDGVLELTIDLPPEQQTRRRSIPIEQR